VPTCPIFADPVTNDFQYIYAHIHLHTISLIFVVMCPLDFNLENGDYELIMDDNRVEYDMVMTCKKGFVMKGVERFTCKDGAWNRVPRQTTCRSKWSKLFVYTVRILVAWHLSGFVGSLIH